MEIAARAWTGPDLGERSNIATALAGPSAATPEAGAGPDKLDH